MSEISITHFIYDKIHYSNEPVIYEILDLIFDNNKSKSGGYLVSKFKEKLHFYNQYGGTSSSLHHITLKDNKTYEYHISKIIPFENNKKQIHFLNIDEDYDDCAFLIFDNDKNTRGLLKIQGIFGREYINFIGCIKSIDENHKYKTGDILMQIILNLVHTRKPFRHIKQIQLSDKSKKKCYDLSLELKFLRTITHGKPYYAKFGFRPLNEYDYNIYKKNYKNFKLDKTISNTQLKNIIDSKITLMTKDAYKIYLKYFSNYVESNCSIDPKLFLSSIITLLDTSIIPNIQEKDIKNNIFVGKKLLQRKNEMSLVAKFVSSIYKDIYHELGYLDYAESIWTLYIVR